jgi:hypothetical protein
MVTTPTTAEKNMDFVDYRGKISVLIPDTNQLTFVHPAYYCFNFAVGVGIA